MKPWSRARLATAGCTALLTALLVAALPRAPLPAPQPNAPAGKEWFAPTKVWAVHLEIPAKEYEAMAPVFGGGFGGPPQPKDKQVEKKDKRDTERNLFGTEFPWVQGEFTADGRTLKKVGVRYAGDITYFVSAQGLKRPLKIAFDKFTAQDFQGLASVQLHSMPLDPAKAREALAFSVFRAAGVPCPRTAFAEVTLTVPGK